jgi:hypothetical protein
MQNVFYSKTQFLAFIARQIKDDEIVVMSDIVSSFNYGKKKGLSVEFCYISAGFKQPDNLEPVARSKNVSLCITAPHKLSDEVKEGLKKGKGVFGYELD